MLSDAIHRFVIIILSAYEIHFIYDAIKNRHLSKIVILFFRSINNGTIRRAFSHHAAHHRSY